MDTKYSPQDIEQHWYQKWERAHYFAAKGDGKPYCIMLPPPNITGSLHMGHGFQHTLMDALIRYQRMQQRAVLWQPGTDHAGISTQMVVERQLQAIGANRLDFSRDAFIEKVWQWKEVSGSEITRQLRRMGSSVDWSRERFTMDDATNAAVIKVFVQLYNEGLIYRGKRLVNWDPKLATAISDLEVIAEEELGHLWHISYPIVGSSDTITIATTRPETLLGDAAVAVHPQDERYQHLIGKQVTLPLCDRLIPIIADDYVDREFGSGCVKITPAHDFNDYEVGKRHQLPLVSILNPNATLNDSVPKVYQGLDRFVARERIIADLTALGLLQKVAPHSLKVPRGEKSGVVIEPLLTDQWFINMQPLAKPAMAAVAKGDIKFVPEAWSKTYFQWMEHIEDWCISRQLWWGHRIPAWYDDTNKIYVGYSEDDVRFKYNLSTQIPLRQDEDVLDTWFSAALWPFTTLGWPNKTPELAKFYPTNVLMTGFDIIFFWVARMIMLGLKFTGKVPFKEVYITGLIRDAEGQKMSKSKGNVLDPIDIIDGISLEALIIKRTSNLMLTSVKDKIIRRTRQEFPEGIAAFGTDALRFTFCALASTGRDIRFDLGRVAGYRNFCNKIWNAARYVIMNTAPETEDWGDGAFQYSPADHWILAKLQHTIKAAHHHFASYRFDLLAHTLYEFSWHEYCDWYLELAKPLLNNPRTLESHKRGTRKTLLQVLEIIMRLLHPIMPFITEEIWRKVAPLVGQHNGSKTIMRQCYPVVQAEFYNDAIEAEINWLKALITTIRNLRSAMHISPAQKISAYFNKGSDKDHLLIKKYRDYLLTLAKLTHLKPHQATSEPAAATALVGELEILIPMAGLIDVAAENARLSKEIAKLQQDLTKTQQKLTNPQFTAHAPVEVVAKEQHKMAQLQSALANLRGKLQQLTLL